jgi:hypothetical protein
MHRISAALACFAVVVTAGCGTAQATADTHPTPGHPTPAHCLHASGVLSNADSGKTYCLRVGDRVGIILHSTERDLWRVPLASNSVLKGVPNGALSLVAGATGAFYKATRPGRAMVTSIRPPCRATSSSTTSYPVKSCAPKDRFTVTIIVS